MTKIILELIKAKFEARLQEKAGWGRNDVTKVYNECVVEALLESVE